MFLNQSRDILLKNTIHKEMPSRVGGDFRWQPATSDNPDWMIVLVACSRVPKFPLPLPLPLLTPATQTNVLDATHATLTLVDVH